MTDRGAAKRRRVEHRLRIAEVVIAGLVFATGVIYAVFAGLQWKTMNRQLELQRTLQEQAERPWLVVSGVSLDRPIKDGEGVAATVILINSGRTPANGVVFGTTISVTDQKIVSDFTLPLSPDSPSVGVIAPGNAVHESGESEYLLGDGGTSLIESKKANIVIYGKVRYNLPRGQGETGFCAIYNSVTKGFYPYKEGNYAK